MIVFKVSDAVILRRKGTRNFKWQTDGNFFDGAGVTNTPFSAQEGSFGRMGITSTNNIPIHPQQMNRLRRERRIHRSKRVRDHDIKVIGRQNRSATPLTGEVFVSGSTS
ncbi:MAG: hypothetical protein ACREBS_02640 [Nitrososphaerales archaeon]